MKLQEYDLLLLRYQQFLARVPLTKLKVLVSDIKDIDVPPQYWGERHGRTTVMGMTVEVVR